MREDIDKIKTGNAMRDDKLENLEQKMDEQEMMTRDTNIIVDGLLAETTVGVAAEIN